jgi:tetratricopeptide (TPR) repeat protein
MRQRERFWIALLALAIVSVADAAAAPLRGVDGLARAYAAILDADFDTAGRLIAEACPPAPDEACLTLEATRLLWRVQLDPEQTRLDGRLTAAVDQAIAAAEAWAAREPTSAEAWFYVGGAYGARVQFRVLRRQHVGAARDGKAIKQALDRALALDPTLADAKFGLGLYEYYADVAPTAAKILRFLLFLPGGDRTRGLARMRDAQREGALLADEAAYQIHLVLLWYENQPREGLALLRTLAARHPRNPYFQRLIAETLDSYLHDTTASRDAWQALLSLADAEGVREPQLADAEARLGLAAALDALGDTDVAVSTLTPLLAREPDEPWGATARTRLALGRLFDRLGDWSKAEALFTAVAEAPPSPDPLGLAAAARRARERPTAFTKGESHRLALAAQRAFDADPSAAVEPDFEKALALDPQNQIARIRYARVLAAHRQPGRAVQQLDAVLRAPGAAPAALVADAALLAGRLREHAHDPIGARTHYRRAAATFGASAATREAATRALTRLDAAKR